MHASSTSSTISRTELRWLLIATLIVVGLSTLPYVFAAVAAPSGFTFGGVLVNPEDGNTYLAKIRQGYEGAWLYQDNYSPEKAPGILIFSFYLIIGQLARLTNVPIVWMYHMARAAAGFLLLVGAYRLASELTPDIQARRWAWAIAAFGSGLGIITQLTGRATVGYLPADFYISQSNIFYSLLANPHFPLTVAFEIWVVLLVNKPLFSKWPESLNLGVIASLGLGIASMAPYLAPVIGLVAATYLVSTHPFNRTLLVRLGVLGTAMSSSLLVLFWQLVHSPAVPGWLGSIVSLSPPFLDTLLGFGLWLPLALVGAWRVWQAEPESRRPFTISLLTWIVIGIAGMYVPLFLQGRFVGGIFAPIAILAGVGVHWFLSLTQGIKQKLLFLLIVGFGFNSNALIVGVAFTAPRQTRDTMYLTNDEMAVFQWLAPRVAIDDVVLADEHLGNFVPAWISARVVYGHSLESLNSAERQIEVSNYYDHGPNTDLLDRYHILYVIGGQMPDGWKIAYQNETLIVYGR